MRLALLLCLVTVACAGQAFQNFEHYVFGFLRAYPNRANLPEAEALAIQKAHIAHLDKMAADGYLVGAGPLASSQDLRGVLIFRGITIDRARELASQDPAVINKRLIVHVENWRAAKGIGEALARRMKEPNPAYNMERYGFMVSWRTAQTPADWNTPEAKSKLREHTAWLDAQASKIAAFGPLDGSKEFLGVAVFHSTDLAEIRKLIADEPFVKAGWIRPELLTWMVAEGVMPEPVR